MALFCPLAATAAGNSAKKPRASKVAPKESAPPAVAETEKDTVAPSAESTPPAAPAPVELPRESTDVVAVPPPPTVPAAPVPPAAPAKPGASAEPIPSAAPAVPPATSSALSIRAGWDDRLVFESEDKRFFLQPIAILQTLFALPYNSAADREYEGIGFSFRRAALGFDLRILRNVRTFFLSNIANGTLTLWDFFTDVDLYDGRVGPLGNMPLKVGIRVGRFRPWMARQRLLAGDRYQMIQMPTALTDLLEIGDGRDLGGGIYALVGGMVECQVGVWNGEQKYSTETVNGFLPSSPLRSRGNIDFEFGSRLVVHPFGFLPAIDESDLEYSQKPKLSFGASALLAKRHDVRAPYSGFSFYDDRQLKAGVELDFRWRGFSFEAEGFLRKAWMSSSTDAAGKTQFEELHLGALGKSAYAQSGYFIVARRLELTGRFDYVDVEPSTPGYMLRPALGLNVFFHSYNVLLQLMYRRNMGIGFEKDKYGKDGDYWRSLRPGDRTDVNLGDRPMSRTTHDVFLMLQTSL